MPEWKKNGKRHVLQDDDELPIATVEQHPKGYGWFFFGPQLGNTSNNGEYFPSLQAAKAKADLRVEELRQKNAQKQNEENADTKKAVEPC